MMRGRHLFSAFFLVTLASVACHGREESLPPVHAAEPMDVSLLQLIATPSEYNGRVVRVIGFCHLEFEGNGLYLHREDFDRAIAKNAVWIDVGRDKQALSDQYVLVEGLFDARRKGHMSMFSGYLTSVTRMERWPSHREFADRLKR